MAEIKEDSDVENTIEWIVTHSCDDEVLTRATPATS
jgi:hypothetical protein